MKGRATKISLGVYLIVLLCGVTACHKDIYDPNASKLPPKEDYFDFSLTRNVQLSVDYNVPGLTAIIEVYDQDPMLDSKTKKEGITPIYVAYTNDGIYQGEMNIPTAVKEAYLYTNNISVQKCVKMDVTENGFAHEATKQELQTRNTWFTPENSVACGIAGTDKLPYKVIAKNGERTDNLYSIMAWMSLGRALYGSTYFTIPKEFGVEKEKVGVVSARVMAYLNAQREIDQNASLLRNPKDVNLRVPATATEGMSVNVTFLGEQAAYHNTFGYYYYEDKGENYTLSPTEFWKIKKYVVIPNAETDKMNMLAGETVKLLYFDENGNQSDKFPANYVIGWFLIGNGFGSTPPNQYGLAGYANEGWILRLPESAYNNATASNYSQSRFSCMSDDKGVDRRFISLYDSKSKLRVIGIEDDPQPRTPDDYMDLVFVVQTSLDLGGGELPPIGPEDPKPDPAIWPVKGTLAFEDVWPNGGDYDLNDVIIEYNRDITINRDNKVEKITETFKPVQKEGSAKRDNFIACQYKNPGKVTLPEGMILESATNSVVVETTAKSAAGVTYTVVRDLSGLGMTQTQVKEDFNPYLIANRYAAENRVEVHLPMFEMTSAANTDLMNKDNAYYIGSGGIFPFAINIPVTGFIPADETIRIDLEGQYPSFAKWANSKGENSKDWYLQDKGKK